MITRGEAARSHLAAQSQPQRDPSDLGDLGKLPPELRNHIYRLALAQPDVVKLQSYQPRDKLHYVIDGKASSRLAGQEVTPVNHKRKSERRCQRWDGKQWIEIPRKAALLQVNKQIKAEASSDFYSHSHFQFTTPSALEHFLTQIGDNKQFLRGVGLPWLRDGPATPAAQRAIEAWLMAKGLREIRLSDSPIYEKKGYQRDSIKKYVSICLPVLLSLYDTAIAEESNADILEALTIDDHKYPTCGQHQYREYCSDECAISCVERRSKGFSFHLLGQDCHGRCKNMCVDFRERCKWAERFFRREVARQLAVSIIDPATLELELSKRGIRRWSAMN